MTAEREDQPRVRPETPPKKRRDVAENRASLLRAAQAALAEHPQVSLDAIAQAAGLSRRALYGHFADRDSLVREVIAVSARQFAAVADNAIAEDPRLALAELAARLWDASTAVRASASIAASGDYVSETASALEPLRQRLSSLMVEGAESGAFRPDISSDTLALLVEEVTRATLRERRVAESLSAETAIKVVLSIAGLSWREQEELLTAHPELRDAGAWSAL